MAARWDRCVFFYVTVCVVVCDVSSRTRCVLFVHLFCGKAIAWFVRLCNCPVLLCFVLFVCEVCLCGLYVRFCVVCVFV